MNYTIVWNENKTEGIILSSDNFSTDAKYAVGEVNSDWYSSLADAFRDIYGVDQQCAINSLSEPTQEMIEAGNKALYSGGEQSVERIYKAMIQKLTCNL